MNIPDTQHLKRILRLRDLIIYGMIILQIVGPLPTFGLLEERSDNHAVLTALIAMVPMLITAISYGRMAFLYPMAGSAYTYVGRGINAHLGFLIGWAMLLDYLMIVLISALIPALAIQRAFPFAPLPALSLMVIVAMTALNLGGIRATLRANMLLLVVGSISVGIFIVLAIRFLGHTMDEGSLLGPLYDRSTFHGGAILRGISLAAITYIGFDGLTTLAEDSINPKRDMVLATVLVVLVTGLLSAIELYFLHRVLPDWHLANPDTSYLDVMHLVGGPALFTTFLIVMSASQFGSGFSVQVNVARLLYGMGRDNALPPSIFGYLSPTRQNPSRNIFLVGLLAFASSLLIPFEHALDLLNFGAFLGFMGVNAAVIWSYYLHAPPGHDRSFVNDLALPSLGFIGCLIFWVGLPDRAKIVGGIWLLIGASYAAYKTRGFRDRPLPFDFKET